MEQAAERDALVHRADGSATSGSGWWFLIVFGVIGALTMIVVAIAIPGKVGPWWLWLLAIVPFVLLGRWELRSSSVVIELVADGDALRLRVRGRGGAIDTVLRPGYERWEFAERVPIRLGGGVMMYAHVAVTDLRGRRIAFQQMGGNKPIGWPERVKLGSGPDVFSTLDIYGLEKALRARGGPADGG